MEEKFKKVLLADKSKDFVMYVSIVLQRMGYKVIPAENGKETLKLLKLFTPDIIMLDPEMPQTDGITALKHIRGDKRTSGIPVIMVSDNKDKHEEECIREGCSVFLTKPVRLTVLNDVIEGHVGGRRRRSLRIPFNKKVAVTHQGVTSQYHAVDLSEGGIYIRKSGSLPAGTEVTVALPLKSEKHLLLNGTVIYNKNLFGEGFRIPPGVAIKFDNLSDRDSALLRAYTLELFTEDLVEETYKTFFRI